MNKSHMAKMQRKQIGGDHYQKMKIQPVDYIVENDMGYMEGNIIKYISRYNYKGGLEDLKKAQHYIEMLIEIEIDEIMESVSEELKKASIKNDLESINNKRDDENDQEDSEEPDVEEWLFGARNCSVKKTCSTVDCVCRYGEDL